VIKRKIALLKIWEEKALNFLKIMRKKVVKFSSIRFGVASSLALEKIYEKGTRCFKILLEKKINNNKVINFP